MAAQRRALLIDTDPGFYDLLAQTLAPYGVAVHAVTDGSDGLGYAAELEPDVIFITVELPDKVGYSICNKAKKGVAKRIPVVLITASVPPSDLAQHRKLKVHADEYIDKRTASAEELISKLDGLINLGAPLEEVPVEFDGDLNVEAEDIHFDDEPASVRYVAAVPPPPPHSSTVDPGIDAETEAVFAGLTDDPSQQAGDETPVDDGGSGESAEPFEAQATHVRSAPSIADEGPDGDSPDATAQEGLDLTMMEGALDDDAGATGGDASRVADLEQEVAELRAELDEARRAPAMPTQFSREREFLNLREVINRKEKEILDLREEVDAKERIVLGGRDKLRELDRKVRDSDEKLLTIEGNLVTANESIAALRTDKDKAAEREKGLKGRIELAQAQLRKADEEFEGLKKRSAAEALGLSTELAARKKELESTRKDASDRVAKLEATHAAALKKADEDRAAALAAREKALGEERDTQLAGLRADLGDKLERARQEATAALAAAKVEHGKQLAAQNVEKEQALARAEKDKRDALEAAAADKDAALEAAEQQRVHELHDAEQRRMSELRAAEDRRIHELADAEDKAQRALEELDATKNAEIAQLKEDGRDALAAAEERRAAEVTVLDARRKEELGSAEERRARELGAAEERRMKELLVADAKRRDDLSAAEQKRKEDVGALEDRQTRELAALKRVHDEERATMIAGRNASEGELRAEIQKLEGQLGQTRSRLAAVDADLARTQTTLREREEKLLATEKTLADREQRIAGQRADIDRLERDGGNLEEQLLRAYQKIKSDEAIANKAKKAMAIALTLLDGEPHKELKAEG